MVRGSKCTCTVPALRSAYVYSSCAPEMISQMTTGHLQVKFDDIACFRIIIDRIGPIQEKVHLDALTVVDRHRYVLIERHRRMLSYRDESEFWIAYLPFEVDSGRWRGRVMSNCKQLAVVLAKLPSVLIERTIAQHAMGGWEGNASHGPRGYALIGRFIEQNLYMVVNHMYLCGFRHLNARR